jgi:hypothetical protein
MSLAVCPLVFSVSFLFVYVCSVSPVVFCLFSLSLSLYVCVCVCVCVCVFCLSFKFVFFLIFFWFLCLSFSLALSFSHLLYLSISPDIRANLSPSLPLSLTQVYELTSSVLPRIEVQVSDLKKSQEQRAAISVQ